MLSKVLIKLGFNQKEANIYLCLLKRGGLVSSSISKHTKLNRSTCYQILEKLTKKNIIQQYSKNNLKYYKAHPPIQLTHLIQAEEEIIYKKKQYLQETLPLLNNITNQNTNAEPKIQYFQGLHGIKQSYEDIIKSGFTVCSIKTSRNIPPSLKKFLYNTYIPKRISKKIQAKIITNKSEETLLLASQDSSQLRETKIVEQQLFNFPIEINIYGNKASFLIFANNKYLSLVIDSTEISNSLKMLFNLLWINY